MKNTFLALLLLLAAFAVSAQDASAPINKNWPVYASDTSLTYVQIIHLCDSLFAQAGYSTVSDTATDTTAHDGSPYWKYQVWKGFWASRWETGTGKLHDFAADALATPMV